MAFAFPQSSGPICSCKYTCRMGEGCLIMILSNSSRSLGLILSGASNLHISKFLEQFLIQAYARRVVLLSQKPGRSRDVKPGY